MKSQSSPGKDHRTTNFVYKGTTTGCIACLHIKAVGSEAGRYRSGNNWTSWETCTPVRAEIHTSQYSHPRSKLQVRGEIKTIVALVGRVLSDPCSSVQVVMYRTFEPGYQVLRFNRDYRQVRPHRLLLDQLWTKRGNDEMQSASSVATSQTISLTCI